MQTGGFPLACGDFPNRRQLDVIHALGQLEEGCHRRIGEQHNPAAGHLFEEVTADGDCPPQVAETKTVLRIDSYPWTVCITHGHFASRARNPRALRRLRCADCLGLDRSFWALGREEGLS